MAILQTPKRSRYPLDFKTGGSHNPIASTAYFVGNLHTSAPATAGAVRRVPIPTTGRIVRADLTVVSGGGGGSAETTAISVRLNDTTSTEIIASINWDLAQQYFSGTGLAIAVTAGDYVELTFTTPAWSASPTAVLYLATLTVETP